MVKDVIAVVVASAAAFVDVSDAVPLLLEGLLRLPRRNLLQAPSPGLSPIV